MECKYANLRHTVRTDTELIDTLWNVNFLGVTSRFREI